MGNSPFSSGTIYSIDLWVLVHGTQLKCSLDLNCRLKHVNRINKTTFVSYRNILNNFN